MTKKAFIWLGIRALGFFWLIRLICAILSLLWMILYFTGHTVFSTATEQNRALTAPSLISASIKLPMPIILTIYFLCFGTLVYKLVDCFTVSRHEDISRPPGHVYCEIIIRFIGLWIVGMMAFSIYDTFMLYLRSALMMHFLSPDNPSNPFVSALRQFLDAQAILSLAFFLVLEIAAAWYFLKHGKFFIALLNRLWLKASGNEGLRSRDD